MPSAVDILQEKRLKAEGETKSPDQIVADQIDEIDKGLPPKKVETKKSDNTDDSSDDQDDIADDDASDNDDGEEDLDEQELKEARMLYKTLKSKPDEARGLIADLANRMGL